MPSDIENLKTARSAFIAKLAEISANPKPTYTIDGQTVKWTEHYKFLSNQIDKLTTQIGRDEPFEIVSQGT